MSLRQLVEGDCGGVNPLMQLGGQFTRDVARKDEGFGQVSFETTTNDMDFHGHMAAPPQSFHMDALLQEMREIETAKAGQNPQFPPPPLPEQMIRVQPQQPQVQHVHEFFDNSLDLQGPSSYSPFQQQPFVRSFIRPTAPYVPPMIAAQPFQPQGAQFFDEPMQYRSAELNQSTTDVENWLNEYQTSREETEQAASSYNEKFWQRLQDEWQKLSEDSEHPWLSEYNETLDPYKEYEFAEENPMSDLDDAFAKGKAYLAQGDIPSAVLCFEVAAKKDPDNAEIWELLGISQAENEMDPHAIAALKRSLDIQADNPRVLMALAVCYTNEGLHSHAIKMLTNWLKISPKYKHLVQDSDDLSEAANLTSSLIGSNKIVELQELYLQASRLAPNDIDSDVQEALGVLYNLSSEFDKAAECFKLALQKNPHNAKIWNRLGASLANGSRSTEAVDAYQKALALEPGFIRVRYNVGVCCMNLKAYKQAAEHLLMALTMQAHTMVDHDLASGAAAISNSQKQMSDSIWNTLKMIISLMGRNELHPLVNERNLDALNAAFGGQ